MTQKSAELSQSLESTARRLGFSQFGIAPAVSPDGFDRLNDWLDNNFSGEMNYIPDRKEAYRHPDSILQGVKSVVMLAFDYGNERPAELDAGQGRIARYAWGSEDYHDLLKSRLRQLEIEFAGDCESLLPDSTIDIRTVVDTAPLLEREFAQLAGLGWFGKNTMLISKSRGSYFFLAALLTNVQLEYDQPFSSSHCGTCTACLDACPTKAFPEAGVLDATRCISYLTIEHRSTIPKELREGIGEWLFGCDVCQEVCPWNRMAGQTTESSFHPTELSNPVNVAQLFFLNDEDFRKRFRKTPLWRSKRRGLLRNAAIVLGNNPGEKSIDALSTGINDEEILVREASAWALGKIGGDAAITILNDRKSVESEESVLSEIEHALNRTKN